jgi:hypothetical protein
VYVADSGHDVVDKFTSAGAYVPGSELTGQPPAVPESKVFSDPDGLAVDPINGDLYVSDKENKLVDFYSPSGEWLGDFPISFKPWSLAINSSGDVYVAGAGGSGRVVEYTAEGSSEVKTFSELEGGFGHVRSVGVDLQTNDAFLGTEFEGVYQLEEVGPAGELTAQRNFGGEGEMSPPGTTSPGIAINSTNGTVYAADESNNVVDVFELVHLPTTETGSSSNVKGTTAKVAGLVNPEGVEAHYFFEYGPCNGNEPAQCPGSVYAEETPKMSLEEPAGSKPEPADASLSGLSPETTYHYRLVGENANGEKQGNEDSFTTGPAVAGVSTTAATSLKSTSATLNGLLDPEGTLTQFFFEYVAEEKYNPGAPNPYGEGVSTEGEPGELSGGTQETASKPIGGLEVGTTYHYRIVTTSEHGRTTGQDETLTTLPALPTVDDIRPFVTNVSPGEATLHGTVNPGRGVTTYHFVYGLTSAHEGSSSLPEVYTQLNYEDDAVEQLLTGLAPNTTYHYALVATNASGTTTGPDQEFTTPAPPPPSVESNGPAGGSSLEIASTPGIAQPLTPALLPTPAYPAIKLLKNPIARKCKKGFVKKDGKCVAKKPARAKKRRK